MFESGRCPILNASIEADDNLLLTKNGQGNIKNQVSKKRWLHRSWEKIGEFKQNINAVDYGYAIISLIKGGIMLAKITNKRHHLFSALEQVTQVIKQEMK